MLRPTIGARPNAESPDGLVRQCRLWFDQRPRQYRDDIAWLTAL